MQQMISGAKSPNETDVQRDVEYHDDIQGTSIVNDRQDGVRSEADAIISENELWVATDVIVGGELVTIDHSEVVSV